MSEDQLAQLAESVRQPWPGGLLWSDVLGQIMTRAAWLGGHSRWGYNTPQDHLHLERLFAAWPNARAVFLLREPIGLLRSYKNVSGPWHDARRYNPTAIGLAWQAAARSYLRFSRERPEQVMLLRYDDLVRDTEAMLRALGRFLETRIPPINLESLGRNTSLDGGRARLPVSDSEVWLATRPIGQELRALGFEAPAASFGLSGAGELARIYGSSAAFHLKGLMFDPDRRRRIFRLLGTLTSRRPQGAPETNGPR